jgi:hypothetical protein
MASRGVDNFDNNGARDYLNMLCTQMVATIGNIAADQERLELEEDGETLFMPSVEVLALLCERYGAPPPQPETVRQWRDKYLKAYDHDVDRLKASPAFKKGRRKVIEQTFGWLLGLAESHWAE